MSLLPTVGVVVLAWQDEPWLPACVGSVLDSADVHVELVVVDNGCRPADLDAMRSAFPDVRVLCPGRNLGFAGGCNHGAAQLSTEFLALVNSDCVLQPDTLAQLSAEAAQAGVGPVMAGIRFAAPPHLVNSAGNPVHLVGLSWAGGLDSVETRTAPYDVTGASGACLMITYSLWKELGGFDQEYFAYLEDTELSLRAWRRGLAARCVPTAVAMHHYEFSRNPTKLYLLERNRLLLVLTLWSTRALWVLAPMLVGMELAMVGYAFATGWGREKVRGWTWLARNRRHVADRRRQLQAEALVPDATWMRRLTTEVDTQVIGSPAAIRLAGIACGLYWRFARRMI